MMDITDGVDCVVFCGGTGMRAFFCEAARSCPRLRLCAVVAVADDGGSSRAVQDGVFGGGGPALGDIRSILLRVAAVAPRPHSRGPWVSPFDAWRSAAAAAGGADSTFAASSCAARSPTTGAPAEGGDWRMSRDSDAAARELDALRALLARGDAAGAGTADIDNEIDNDNAMAMASAVRAALARGAPRPVACTSVGNLALAGLLLLHERELGPQPQRQPLLDAVLDFGRRVLPRGCAVAVVPAVANATSATRLRLVVRAAGGAVTRGQCQISYGRDSVVDVVAAKEPQNSIGVASATTSDPPSAGSVAASRPVVVAVEMTARGAEAATEPKCGGGGEGDSSGGGGEKGSWHAVAATGGPVPRMVRAARCIVLGSGSFVTSLMSAACSAPDTVAALQGVAAAARDSDAGGRVTGRRRVAVVLLATGGTDHESTAWATAIAAAASCAPAEGLAATAEALLSVPVGSLITDVCVVAGSPFDAGLDDAPASPSSPLPRRAFHRLRSSAGNSAHYCPVALTQFVGALSAE